MAIRQEHVGTVAAPLHRTLEIAGREKAHDRFGMQAAADAETTAGVTGNHAHRVALHAEDGGRGVALAEGPLAGVV